MVLKLSEGYVITVWCLVKHRVNFTFTFYCFVCVCCRPESNAICLRGHSGSVQGIAVIPDELLVSVSHDATMRAWRMDDFSCAAVYRYSILQKSFVSQFFSV
jgi:WD40 repeat protein